MPDEQPQWPNFSAPLTVSMLDDVDVVKDPAQFWHLAMDIGKWAFCESLLTGSTYACASPWRDPSTDETVSVDIILRRSVVDTGSLDVPAVALSRCIPDSAAYFSFAHEAGHALGIRDGQTGTGQERHHAWVTSSTVMIGSGLCEPGPLDVLAMYAIYQAED